MPLFDTGTVELGDGDTVEIRELTVPQLREADKRGTEAMVTLMGLMPEKIVSDELERSRQQSVERIIRYEGYDPEVLLQFGITSWSFDEECTEDTRVNLLGAKKGEQVARAIFVLSVLDAVEGKAGSSSTPSPTEASPHGHLGATASSKSEGS